MSTPSGVTATRIRDLATSQAFGRGSEYYRAGAVLRIEQRGDLLLAQVSGSQPQPYRVTVRFKAGGVADFTCDCEYDWGGACKHVVAALLAAIGKPDQIEQRPTVEGLLSGLDRDALQELLQSLLYRQPELVDWVESQLSLRRSPVPPGQPSSLSTSQAESLDTSVLRRQIQKLKRSFNDYEADWGNSKLVDTLFDALARARQYVDDGDGRAALEILAALVEETVDDWYEYDLEGEYFATFYESAGQLLTEAVLCATLSETERSAWGERITQWQAALDEESGLEIDAFDAAQAAAIQGWDDATLERVLRGESTDQGVWHGETPWYAQTLIAARLRVLERQGRSEEYLNLAKADRQAGPYTAMLVKLGRVREAVEVGLQHLASAGDALVLAQLLRSQMHSAEALRIAEHGLALAGDPAELARWLHPFALGKGSPELALRAARIALVKEPALADYRTVQSLAGDRWPSIKTEVLAQIEETHFGEDLLDIYLYEQMIDEAIKVVERVPYLGHHAVEKVVDAALTARPEWAIRQCRRQAEPIMNGGRSGDYAIAAYWLEKARRAYLAAGRGEAWQSYLQGILEKHHRKWSLVPLLRPLLLEDS